MTKRPTWDQVWMHQADAIAPRSRCCRARVGVVIVSKDNRHISSGYNGPPAGLQVDGDCSHWCPRAQRTDGSPDPVYDDCHAAHAETNAIARADYSQMAGSTLYVTTSMCKGCAKVVANSGVTRVVYRYVGDGSDAYRSPDLTEQFLEDCGVSVVRWSDSSE